VALERSGKGSSTPPLSLPVNNLLAKEMGQGSSRINASVDHPGRTDHCLVDRWESLEHHRQEDSNQRNPHIENNNDSRDAAKWRHEERPQHLEREQSKREKK
jgi:hypothetical protein